MVQISCAPHLFSVNNKSQVYYIHNCAINIPILCGTVYGINSLCSATYCKQNKRATFVTGFTQQECSLCTVYGGLAANSLLYKTRAQVQSWLDFNFFQQSLNHYIVNIGIHKAVQNSHSLLVTWLSACLFPVYTKQKQLSSTWRMHSSTCANLVSYGIVEIILFM